MPEQSADETGNRSQDQHHEEPVTADRPTGSPLTIFRRPLLKVIGAGTVLGGGLQSTLGRVSPGSRDDAAAALSSTATGGGRIARALATDGDRAVVGMGPADVPVENPATEQAVVLRRENGAWGREAVLSRPDSPRGFGAAVALDGDTALVGITRDADDRGIRAGAVAIFQRNGASWARVETLSPPDPSGMAQFGAAVALDGDTALVGAPADTNERGFRVGAVSVFQRADGGWRREETLLPTDDVDRFGRALALDGDTAVVGARLQDSGVAETGAVTVFSRRAGTWTRTDRLVPEGSDRNDGFGSAVALEGETAVVGAPTETTEAGTSAGSASVYARRGGSWDSDGRLSDPDARSDRHFGSAVAVAGDRAVVGSARTSLSTGGVTVFERTGTGWRHRSGTAESSDRLAVQRNPVVAMAGRTAVAVGTDGTAGTGADVEVLDP